MKEKLIKLLVSKLWDDEAFQKEICRKIVKNADEWLLDNFGKRITNFKEFDIVHNPIQDIPFIYRTFEEVEEAVKRVEELKANIF